MTGEDDPRPMRMLMLPMRISNDGPMLIRPLGVDRVDEWAMDSPRDIDAVAKPRG